MKRKPLIPLYIGMLLIICSEVLHAQGHFYVEAMGQPQDAMITGDQYIYNQASSANNPQYLTLEKKFTFSMAEGIAAGYRFNDHTGVSVGIMYSNQGQDYATFHQDIKGTNINYDYDHSVSLNYLKVPVLFHYTLPMPDKLALSFYGGLYVGFLLNYEISSTLVEHNLTYTDQSGNIIYQGNVTVVETIIGTTITDQGYPASVITISNDNAALSSNVFNTVDAGAMIGAGIDFKLSEKLSIPFMLNYTIGLTDIRNRNATVTDEIDMRYGFAPSPFWGSGTDPDASAKLSNSTLGISVGLKMNL